MDKRAALVLGIIFGGLFLTLFGFLLVLYLGVKGDGQGAISGDRVGVVEVVGPITDSKRTLKDLNAFKDDEHIHAIATDKHGLLLKGQGFNDGVLASFCRLSGKVHLDAAANSRTGEDATARVE